MVAVRRIFIVGSLLTLAACGDDPTEMQQVPINHTDVIQNLDGNLKNTMPRADAIPAMLESSSLFQDTLGALLQDCEVSEVCEPIEGTDEFHCESVEHCEDFEFPALEADDIADFLTEEIFVEANVESATETEVTYRVDLSIFCDDEEDAEAGETEEEACEPPDVPVLISVTSFGGGDLDLKLLVGPDRVNPVDLRLYRSQMGARIDLAAAKTAMEAFLDEGDDLGTVQGVVDVSLQAMAGQKFKANVAILEAVAVAIPVEDGQDIAIDLAAANPLASVDMDFANNTMTGTLDMGPLGLSLPLDALFGGEECEVNEQGEEVCTEIELPAEPLHIALGGLNGQLNFDAASEVLLLTGAGLGESTSTVHIGAQQVIGIDINADHGRTFDAEISADGDTISIAPSPLLTAAIAFQMEGVDLDLPAWMNQENLAITFDGENPSISLGEQVQVTSGRLLFSSSTFGDSEIEAGMCIGHEEIEDADGHPFAGLQGEVCE